MKIINRVSIKMIAMIGMICGYTAAQAASISYYLNQSNVDSSLPDGVNYALVTINDDISNSLIFTVSLLAPLTSIQGNNFGIQDFSFNVLGTNSLSDSGSVAGQWTLPNGWRANAVPPPNNTADGFGVFDVQLNSTGQNRAQPLTFSINNTALNLFSFLEASANSNGQGNVYFAARVAGLNAPDNVSGGFFGGSAVSAVPLPAALPLLLTALGGFSFFIRRRR